MPKTELSEWFTSQYKASVSVTELEGGVRYKKFISNFPEESKNIDYPVPISGSVRNFDKFLPLKLRHPLGPYGYTCVVFSITLEKTTSHYAYAYWRQGASDNQDPEYICISPTYESRDGEYRRRFIPFKQFLKKFEDYIEQITPFEEIVLDMVTTNFIELSTNYYSGMGASMKKIAEELRIPIIALAMALLTDSSNIVKETFQVHMNRNYTKIITGIVNKYPQLTGLTEQIDDLYNIITIHPLEVSCGQKIVPLYSREVANVYDFNYTAWRELIVARAVSDLVVNFISPSFSIYNQWTYIEGVNLRIFENAAMMERYRRGLAAEGIVASLRDARRGLAPAEILQNIATEELGGRIYEDIEYAESTLLMSDIAILHTMEDVGPTAMGLATLSLLANISPVYTRAITDYDTVARHLFEYVYAAHCLHTKIGVAHTDLHGNNMTLYQWGELYNTHKINSLTKFTPFYENAVVAYVAGPRGEADTYVFPASGDSACLIDYSRVIIGPGFRPRLTEGRSEQYAENFYRDQVNRAMRTLHRYAPDYVLKHNTVLKGIAIANFEALFPVLCAVDFIAIGISCNTVLVATASAAATAVAANPDAAAKNITVAPGALELCTRIEVAGREALISGLIDLVRGGVAGSGGATEFPGTKIIAKIFEPWTYAAVAATGSLRGAALVDVYNYNNSLQYSEHDYSKYPPWAHLDEIERHLGEFQMTDICERGVEPFLNALRPSTRPEVLAEMQRAAIDKLDGPPAAAMSSWLNE